MEPLQCIYCSAPADSLEHPLPAALGEFQNAPLLNDRICKHCNHKLGLLDEQWARCGPEAILRRILKVRGRTKHDCVNVFERGSAGGQRLDLKARDKVHDFEVAMEIEDGVLRQMRQIAALDKSGQTHHLPIAKGTTPERLRADFERLRADRPFEDIRAFYDPATEDWVRSLIEDAWPSVTIGEGNLGSTMYHEPVAKVVLTNRYFRAIAKIGFHYFLTQFPEYTGHEEMFESIRLYIFDESAGVDRTNAFIGKREDALLAEMLNPSVQPNGWCAHVLGVEAMPGQFLAYVQTFVMKDWLAPIYVVRLA